MKQKARFQEGDHVNLKGFPQLMIVAYVKSMHQGGFEYKCVWITADGIPQFDIYTELLLKRQDTNQED